MRIKEFEALTLKDGLQQVRSDLGPDAVILETRKFRKGGILGWGGRDAVRILAATGVSVSESRPRSSQPAAPRPAPAARPRVEQGGVATVARPVATPTTQNGHHERQAAQFHQAALAQVPQPTSEDVERLEREIKELKTGFDAVRQVVMNGSLHQAVVASPGARPHGLLVPELFARLRDAEISESLAQELMESLPDLSAWSGPARIALAESAMRDILAGRARTVGAITATPGKLKTVALVGPTGVGKTTTIAKLAAHFALVEKRKVGLLSMDTYRIAAVEQLKTYSQIIDIPIKVAYNQSDIAPALKSFRDCDIVLVDTAGRSQKNVMQVGELKSLLDSIGCETHLVLAASTKERDMRDQIERFTKTGADRIIFTKLDETTTYGTMYTAAIQSGLAISYITTGQKVPEDIEVADGAKITSLVLGDTPSAR